MHRHSALLLVVIVCGVQNTMAKHSDCSCGVPGEPIEQRIRGGNETKPHQYPWMISIYSWSDVHHCGGCIISNQHILTAGHCIESILNTKYHTTYIMIGAHDMKKADGKRYHIGSLYMHPKYAKLPGCHCSEYDVAIVRTDEPFEFSKKVWPICLPLIKESTHIYDHSIAIMAGWGAVKEASVSGARTVIKRGHKLKAASVKVLSFNDCQKKMGAIIRQDRMFCAVSKFGEPCKGDSGGPLFRKRPESNQMEVIGVASFNDVCNNPNPIPTVYYSVMADLEWIRAIIRGANSCFQSDLCWRY